MLNINLHPMLRERMSGVISPHHHMPSWCAQEQLYIWRTDVLWYIFYVMQVVPDIFKNHTASSWAFKDEGTMSFQNVCNLSLNDIT